MIRQPARVLEPADVRRLLAHVASHRHATRNQVMVLASFKAGLRACEISGLTWPMVLKSTGKISDRIVIPGSIAKYGSGRTIPMHIELKKSLQQHHRSCGQLKPQSVVNWFGAVYREMGICGASSHSGRRTFVTTSARSLSKVGGSLRDVQELAGHRALSTTEHYIQGDRDAQRRLIALI